MPADTDGQSAGRDLQSVAVQVRRDFGPRTRGRRPAGVRPSEVSEDEDYSAFAACLPKDVLISGAKAAGRTDIRVSWPKAKLVDYFLAQVPFEVAAEHCGAAKFIALDNIRPLEFLLYLYFGKTENDLKNFALRDLGIMRTNKVTSFKARFTDGDEARACFHYSRLLDRLEVKSLSIYQDAVTDIFRRSGLPERLCRRSPQPRRLAGRSVLREAGRDGSRQAALSRRFVAGMQ